MRPHTVYALGQLIRHTRGCVTTIEKWVENTPPEAFGEECDEVIWTLRKMLTNLSTTLGTVPSAPVPAPPTTTIDRPAVQAARSSVPPDGT